MTPRENFKTYPQLSDALAWLDNHVVLKKHIPSSDKGIIIQKIFLWLIKEGILKDVHGIVPSTGYYETIGKTKLPAKNVFFDILRESIFVFPSELNPNNYDSGHYETKDFDDTKYLRYSDVHVNMRELSKIQKLPDYIISKTDYINILAWPYIKQKSYAPQRRGAETINKKHYIKRQKIINTYNQLYYDNPDIKTLPINELTDLLYNQLNKSQHLYSKDAIKNALTDYKPSATITFDDEF